MQERFVEESIEINAPAVKIGKVLTDRDRRRQWIEPFRQSRMPRRAKPAGWAMNLPRIKELAEHH
jgi:hypothetical protein